MNSSVLQFTLGLGTGSFLHALGDAKGKVVGFIGSVAGFGAIMEGVFSAIEKGAALDQLSRRTTTAVSDLFQLQKGFKAADVDVDSLGNTLFQLQKALGGVSESGEDTKSIFSKMGLNVDDLKKQNAPEQINAILKSLDSLGTSEAAKAASSIFGRMNAQNIVQLTNSSEEFAAAMKAATKDAKNWERIAPLFDSVEQAMKKIKSIGSNLFAGIAEGVAPALLAFVDWLQSFETTLANIGKAIGNVFKGLTQAVRENKLGEALKLTFGAAMEYAVNLLEGAMGSSNFWSGIWNIMVGSFKVAMGELMAVFQTFWAVQMTGMDYLVDHLREAMGGAFSGAAKFGAEVMAAVVGPVAGAALKYSVNKAIELNQGYKAPDASVRYQQNEKFLNDLFGRFGSSNLIQSGAGNLANGAKDMGKAIKDGFDKANAGGIASMQLEKFWAGLIDRSPALPAAKNLKKSGDSLIETNHYKPEFTAFEKMGFVMGGAGNPLLAPTQRTAHNTDRMAHALDRLVGAGAGNQENKV